MTVDGIEYSDQQTVPYTYTVTFDSDGGSDVEAQTVAYGKKAEEPDIPTRDGYTFSAWQLDGENYDFDSPVTGSITLTAVWDDKVSVIIKGVSGSFNDRIKLNFCFDIPNSLLADAGAYVTLTNGSSGYEVKLFVAEAELISGNGYKFSIPLAAKEAKDTITARMFDGNGDAITILGSSGNDYTEAGVQRTLMEYFAWLESNGTANEKKIGKAAKDYCSAAMIYFGYNADGITVSDDVNAVSAETLDAFLAGREVTLPSGVSFKGITALLESDNTLRLYFQFTTVDPENLTFCIDGNETELTMRSDGAYYLTLDAGVWSNRLQDTHTYSVSDGTNTYTVSASVLTFARSCIVSRSKNTQVLGKALYLYNQAATELFGN